MTEGFEIQEAIGGYLVRVGDIAAGVHPTKEAAELWVDILRELILAKDSLIHVAAHRGNLFKMVDDFEAGLIRNALNATNWNKTQAAIILGIPRTTLQMATKRLGIRSVLHAEE